MYSEKLFSQLEKLQKIQFIHKKSERAQGTKFGFLPLLKLKWEKAHMHAHICDCATEYILLKLQDAFMLYQRTCTLLSVTL